MPLPYLNARCPLCPCLILTPVVPYALALSKCLLSPMSLPYLNACCALCLCLILMLVVPYALALF